MTTTKFKATAKQMEKAEKSTRKRIHHTKKSTTSASIVKDSKTIVNHELIRHRHVSHSQDSTRSLDLVIPGNGNTITNPGLDQYPIDKLIEWRNSASKRVDHYDAEIRLISAQIASLISSLKKTKKRRESDAVWIRRIHKNLHKKIFKNR